MSKEIVKNYGKSIRSKLLNISKNENMMYAHERFAARQSIPFSEVVEYLQERLQPYWDNLNH